MTVSARTDAFTFYATSVISFLESAVPNYVDNLQPYFGDCDDTSRWLRETWSPEELAHGRITRTYVEHQWPEFSWEAAYAEFLRFYAPQCGHELLRPSKALEALARCVTETGAAMIYRCIGEYTRDAELKSMMHRMSQDEIRHYTYFRDLFDRHDGIERNSFLTKAKTILARSELVRDEDLALAFRPLNSSWRRPMPFGPLSYSEFLNKASQVMSQHLPVEMARRMLFRPLINGHIWEKMVIAILAVLVRRQYAIESYRF